ncbi:MAG: PQQ-binding-like beta-propeller repeat protein [Planctomycetota bacterium]|nr:PQQ-binding-like beta-propeller repeat protein [Planctomycetota bacterium]
MSPRALLVSAAILCLSPSLPASQPQQADRDRLPGGKNFHLEDPEVRHGISRALALAAEGDWASSVDLLQKIIEQSESSLVSTDGRLFRPSRATCHDLIARFPAEGLRAYRDATDPKAGPLFETAEAAPDKLQEVAERFLCSSFGDDALERAGDIYLDRNDPDRALSAWRTLCFRYPLDTNVDRTHLLVKMSFAASRIGRRADASEWLDEAARIAGDRPIRIGGEQVRLGELRSRWLPQRPAGTARAEVPVEWMTWGGDASRSRLSPGIEGALDSVPSWEIRLEESFEPNRRITGLEFTGVPYSRHLPMSSVAISAGTIVWRRGATLMAADLGTGEEAWTGSWPERRPRSLAGPPKVRQTRRWMAYVDHASHGITIAGGKVYVLENGGIPTPPIARFYRLSDASAPFHLVAYDLWDGRRLWSARLADVDFLSTPASWKGRLYVPAERGGARYVACFDGRTGKVLWKTYVSGIARSWGFQPGVPVAVEDGLVYHLGGMGIVSALDAIDGSVQWAHRYRRHTLRIAQHYLIRLEGNEFSARIGRRNGPDYSRNWAPAPPIVHAGRILLAPSDTNLLLCLNARTGELLWQGDKDRSGQYLLGVTAGLVIVGGKSVLAYELDTGRRIWSYRGEDEWTGRGIASAEHVYLPGRKKVVRLVARSGRRDREYPMHYKEMGNLTIVPGTLLATRPDRLVAYNVGP